MDNIDLSIIVPAYNVEQYIERCIESLVNQMTNYKFEIIVVNDGSTDNTVNVLTKYKKYHNIKIFSKENGGLSSARNYGIKKARGDYLGFVDSDDWVSQDMFDTLLTTAKEYNSDITGVHYVETSKKLEYSLKEKNVVTVFEKDDKLIHYLESGIVYDEREFSVCSKIYKSFIFEQIKFPDGKLYEDMITNYLCFQKANKFVLCSKGSYFYFINEKGITSGKFGVKQLDSMLTVKKTFQKLALKEKSTEVKKMLNLQSAKMNLSIIRQMIVFDTTLNDDDSRKIMMQIAKENRENLGIFLKSHLRFIKKIEILFLCNGNFINLLRESYGVLKSWRT